MKLTEAQESHLVSKYKFNTIDLETTNALLLGPTIREIGSVISRGDKTVKYRLTVIYKKLGITEGRTSRILIVLYNLLYKEMHNDIEHVQTSDGDVRQEAQVNKKTGGDNVLCLPNGNQYLNSDEIKPSI